MEYEALNTKNVIVNLYAYGLNNQGSYLKKEGT